MLKEWSHARCHNRGFLAVDLAIMRHSLLALSDLSLLRVTLPMVGQREYKPQISISREDFRKWGERFWKKSFERERERESGVIYHASKKTTTTA